MAGLALDQRVAERRDVTGGLPDRRRQDHRGVEADDVVAAGDHRLPPLPLDVLLELDTERAVVPGRPRTAVDLRRREHETSALGQTDHSVVARPGGPQARAGPRSPGSVAARRARRYWRPGGRAPGRRGFGGRRPTPGARSYSAAAAAALGVGAGPGGARTCQPIAWRPRPATPGPNPPKTTRLVQSPTLQGHQRIPDRTGTEPASQRPTVVEARRENPRPMIVDRPDKLTSAPSDLSRKSLSGLVCLTAEPGGLVVGDPESGDHRHHAPSVCLSRRPCSAVLVPVPPSPGVRRVHTRRRRARPA